MKDLFGLEAYWAIVTQVLPGLIGSASWIIALNYRSPGARLFLSQNTPVATAVLFLVAVFWGFVCYDLGSRAEFLIEKGRLVQTHLRQKRIGIRICVAFIQQNRRAFDACAPWSPA